MHLRLALQTGEVGEAETPKEDVDYVTRVQPSEGIFGLPRLDGCKRLTPFEKSKGSRRRSKRTMGDYDQSILPTLQSNLFFCTTNAYSY